MKNLKDIIEGVFDVDTSKDEDFTMAILRKIGEVSIDGNKLRITSDKTKKVEINDLAYNAIKTMGKQHSLDEMTVFGLDEVVFNVPMIDFKFLKTVNTPTEHLRFVNVKSISNATFSTEYRWKYGEISFEGSSPELKNVTLKGHTLNTFEMPRCVRKCKLEIGTLDSIELPDGTFDEETLKKGGGDILVALNYSPKQMDFRIIFIKTNGHIYKYKVESHGNFYYLMFDEMF